MDVGDLFQLQCTFHGNRILIATAEEQRVVLVGEALRQRFNAFVQRQHLFDTRRQRLQAVYDFMLNAFRHAFQSAQTRHQHQQHRQLGGEGLGRGHANFGPGLGHQRQIGFTHQRRTGHVTHRQRTEVAQFLRQAQRRQGIGGFAGL
ncbi:hypothetical protein D3C71_1606660 [compost metagenome]